ncbi:lipopolysaccharide transport periplasmic protein LptA [Hahella sp. SMD15-11]|uniref:Lipopolysaccharide export system protein LptA n=1 Tax=Thermohahella caldifontis TaxID=3142973 RepID=A0AB39V0K3_9GAMM
MKFNLLSILSALILALSGISATRALELAASTDPIRVQADRAQLDEASGKATYSGHVVVTQGEARLEAETVILYRDAQGVSRVEAHGQPAYLRQIAPGDTVATEAWGETLVYSRDTQTLELLRGARLKQGTNVFRGNTIHYNTRTRVVDARFDENTGTGRVEMIITPANKEAPAKP